MVIDVALCLLEKRAVLTKLFSNQLEKLSDLIQPSSNVVIIAETEAEHTCRNVAQYNLII